MCQCPVCITWPAKPSLPNEDFSLGRCNWIPCTGKNHLSISQIKKKSSFARGKEAINSKNAIKRGGTVFILLNGATLAALKFQQQFSASFVLSHKLPLWRARYFTESLREKTKPLWNYWIFFVLSVAFHVISGLQSSVYALLSWGKSLTCRLFPPPQSPWEENNTLLLWVWAPVCCFNTCPCWINRRPQSPFMTGPTLADKWWHEASSLLPKLSPLPRLCKCDYVIVRLSSPLMACKPRVRNLG